MHYSSALHWLIGTHRIHPASCALVFFTLFFFFFFCSSGALFISGHCTLFANNNWNQNVKCNFFHLKQVTLTTFQSTTNWCRPAAQPSHRRSVGLFFFCLLFFVVDVNSLTFSLISCWLIVLCCPYRTVSISCHQLPPMIFQFCLSVTVSHCDCALSSFAT